MADASVFLMNNYSDSEIVNIGVGQDISISELAEMVKSATRFTGEINYDTSKPDGTPRKLMDNSRLSQMGWYPEVNLKTGIRLAYADFKQRVAV